MTESKELCFKCVEDGKLKWKIVDQKSSFHDLFYKKAIDCDLVLESKTLVPMDDHSKRYGYRYKYKITPDPKAKFVRCELVDKRSLIGEYIYETIEENPKPV